MTEHDAADDQAPTQDTAHRLAALARENADLRAQVDALSAAASAPAPARPAPRHRARAVLSAVLIVLGVVLAPVSVVVGWAQAELTDTDRYVATVGPLAEDPVIRSAVANRLTSEVMAQLDVGALLDEAVGALDEQGLPPRVTATLSALEVPLTNGVRSFVLRAATRVVESDAFTTAWVEANRTAHRQMVAVMRGEEASVLQIGNEGQLTIQLSGMIDLLKSRLVEGGFGLAASIPAVNASFTLVQTSELVRVQDAYQLLDVAGSWLPWIALLLVAAGALIARHRSRALVVAGLALAGAMLLLGLGLAVGRTVYLRALSDQVMRLDAAAVVFDQLVAFIRLSLRTVGVAALVVAAAAYLAGPSASARALRGGSARGFAAVRTWAAGRGVSSGPVGSWLFRHRAPVRVVVLAVAGLVVLLAPSPTAGLVVVVALVAGTLVVLVELVARPPGTPVPGAGGPSAGVGAG